MSTYANAASGPATVQTKKGPLKALSTANNGNNGKQTQPSNANNTGKGGKENRQQAPNTRSKTKDDSVAQILEAVRNIDPKQPIPDHQKPFNDIIIKMAECLNTLQGRIGMLEAENDKKTTTIKSLEEKVNKLQSQVKTNNHNQSAQKKELESFAATVRNSEEIAKRQEAEKSKTSIFVRGLDYHENSTTVETKDQTVEIAQGWANMLGVQVRINDAKRLKPKDNNSVGAIIINFATYAEKIQIYKALS